MATQTRNVGIGGTSDALFRDWGSEVSDMLDSLGLMPKTATSGQVDWTTATRSTTLGANYEVRYLDDSLHSTRPLIFKFNFHFTGASFNNQFIVVELFSGLDASNNPTGLIGTFTILSASNTGTITAPMYMCALPGYFGFAWNVSSAQNGGCVVFARSQTESGVPTAEGISVVGKARSEQGPTNHERRTFIRNFETNATIVDASGTSTSGNVRTCFVPGDLTDGVLPSSGDVQYFRHFAAFPRVRPLRQLLTLAGSHIGVGSTFAARPVGDTDATYLSLAAPGGSVFSINTVFSTRENNFAAILFE